VNARQWLEEVRHELARQKLPSLYAERLLSELSDHITDFLEDPMSTDVLDREALARRLGLPQQIVQSAAVEYPQRKFLGRHPVFGFVALPVVTLIGMWIVAGLAFAIAAKLCGLGTGGGMSTADLPAWANYGLASLVFALVLAPIALAAWLFCRLALRCGVSRKWLLTACVILAVIGGGAFFDVALPGTGQRGLLHKTRFPARVLDQNSKHGAVTMGFGFGLSKYPHWWQVVQFSVPLVICGIAVYREIAMRRRMCAD
jgi:hypothetical protein